MKTSQNCKARDCRVWALGKAVAVGALGLAACFAVPVAGADTKAA